MKVCTACQHHEVSENGWTFDKCRRKLPERNLVNGEVTPPATPTYCQLERNRGGVDALLFRACGRSGRYWIAKESA